MRSKKELKSVPSVSSVRSDSSNASNSTIHSSGSSTFDDFPAYGDSIKKRKTGGADHDKGKKPTKARKLIRDDTEFAADDYEGRARRYREHIAAGYNVDFYMGKLQRLLEYQTNQAKIMKQFPGKSWETIQRMKDLKMIKSYLEKKGDPHKELRNVRAVMRAYESGDLKSDGNATYWCRGKMIAGPKPFEMDDFKKLNTPKNRGSGGFWVEGAFFNNIKRKPRKNVAYGSNVHLPSGCLQVDITLRLDSTLPQVEICDVEGDEFPEIELRFLDDTGSCVMCIFQDDMQALMGANTRESNCPMEHIMGYSVFTNCDGGQAVNMVIAVEANCLGHDLLLNDQYMSEKWQCIPTAVFEKSEYDVNGPSDRLSGPYFRNTFFVGSSPERPFFNFYAGQTKEDLGAILPDVLPSEITQAHYITPDAGVKWGLDFDLKWKADVDHSIKGRVPHEGPKRLL